MKLAHIEVCNAVLLAGSVTGAARMLHLTQPAVTKMLQSAEAQFGFKLFSREKNRLVPTQEALDLHPEILEIASRIDRLREFSRALASEKSSVLRIDCPPSIASALVPVCIERFAALFPRVSCEVETHTHPDIIQRLLRRQCDVGFSLASLPNPAVIEEVVVHGRAVCVVPHGMMSTTKSSVTWKTLAAYPLIRVPPGGQFGSLVMEASHYTSELKPGSLTVSTNYLAMRMAERGLGIASIDSFTAAFVDRAKARIVALTPETPVDIYALRAYRSKPTHPARRFIEIMAAVGREAHAASAAA